MRTVFEEELQQLFVDLSALGNAANESLHKAMRAQNTNDRELAHELFSDDLRINASTIDIEQAAYRVIALQQPVARDLRKVFTVLQASTDIERIADHAVSIARVVTRREEPYHSSEVIDEQLNRIATIVSGMLSDAIDAVYKRDSDLAREVAARDKEADELFKEVLKESSKSMEASSDAHIIASGIGYIQIASSLERIGDYCKNICERVVYLNTGTILELT